MKKFIIKKEILIVFILIGFFGSILFCPVKMESGKTCLFHKLLSGNVEQISEQIPIAEKNHLTLKRYLIPFGFFWWFSIILFISSFYYLKNSNQRS